MRIVSVYMRIASALFLAGIALACSEKKYEMFSLEEANKCLFESDKKAVFEAVEWIKKAETAEDEETSVEYFGRVKRGRPFRICFTV